MMLLRTDLCPTPDVTLDGELLLHEHHGPGSSKLRAGSVADLGRMPVTSVRIEMEDVTASGANYCFEYGRYQSTNFFSPSSIETLGLKPKSRSSAVMSA